MGKVISKAVFKEYNQQQIHLLPQSLDELIPSLHLVRVVNQVVDQLDLSGLINQYEGGGSSAYHPKMLTKVLLYGYSMKIYTGRKLAKALKQDVTFMWLAGYNQPDFRTINLFRSGVLKDTIEELFKELLLFLVEHGYVQAENYFTDGTTLSADANGHKMIWRKNAERFKVRAEEKCQELFKEIDALNTAEELQYEGQDLAEMGSKPVTKDSIKAGIEKLTMAIEKTAEKRKKRKAASLKNKVIAQGEKITKYEQQLEISQQRSGYSMTDPDATAMMMKNQELLPAYNVMASSEDQFITGISVHQNPNDGVCFKKHLEGLPFTPEAIVADSIFGTEENYELLEGNQIESYLKYPTFDREQTRGYKDNMFLKEHFSYNADADTYVCPNSQRLRYMHTRKDTQRSGYVSTSRVYEAENCGQCPMREACTKSKENNRSIRVNQQLDIYKKLAHQKLHSRKGQELLRRRGYEIESCFGDIKHNMGFRRFHLRGLKKVKAEITIVSMAHNLRKLQLERARQIA